MWHCGGPPPHHVLPTLPLPGGQCSFRRAYGTTATNSPLWSPTNIHTFLAFQFSHPPTTPPKPNERFLDATVQNHGFGEGILTPAESRGGGAGTQALHHALSRSCHFYPRDGIIPFSEDRARVGGATGQCGVGVLSGGLTPSAGPFMLPHRLPLLFRVVPRASALDGVGGGVQG